MIIQCFDLNNSRKGAKAQTRISFAPYAPLREFFGSYKYPKSLTSKILNRSERTLRSLQTVFNK